MFTLRNSAPCICSHNLLLGHLLPVFTPWIFAPVFTPWTFAPVFTPGTFAPSVYSEDICSQCLHQGCFIPRTHARTVSRTLILLPFYYKDMWVQYFSLQTCLPCIYSKEHLFFTPVTNLSLITEYKPWSKLVLNRFCCLKVQLFVWFTKCDTVYQRPSVFDLQAKTNVTLYCVLMYHLKY